MTAPVTARLVNLTRTPTDHADPRARHHLGGFATPEARGSRQPHRPGRGTATTFTFDSGMRLSGIRQHDGTERHRRRRLRGLPCRGEPALVGRFAAAGAVTRRSTAPARTPTCSTRPLPTWTGPADRCRCRTRSASHLHPPAWTRAGRVAGHGDADALRTTGTGGYRSVNRELPDARGNTRELHRWCNAGHERQAGGHAVRVGRVLDTPAEVTARRARSRARAQRARTAAVDAARVHPARRSPSPTPHDLRHRAGAGVRR